jgi:DNA-binding LacI/PurR family transcriptional regulator
MARKKVFRALPVLPRKAELQRAVNKTERLIEILRKVALKNQQEQPRAFYSVRQVAKAYKVPLSTVSRVYHQLEQEGLLTRVRGSKTLLQGLHFDRKLGVRAFVGLPASLSAFVTIQAYRMFFIRIRRELRLRGFATAMMFFDKRDLQTAAFTNRLKAYEIDTVLWFQPPSQARPTLEHIGDLGIRVILIGHEQFPTLPYRYDVRRDRAILDMLTHWKTELNIEAVAIPQWKDRPASAVDEALRAILNDLGIKPTAIVADGQRSESFVQSLQRLNTGGIIFSSGVLAAKLCFRAPDAVAELLRGQRVAFLNGPVSMPFATVPDAKVDLALVDWQLVAEEIVNDLISQEAFQQTGPKLFEAEAKLRVPLSAFAQSI